MVREGTLERLGRGEYRMARDEITEHHGLVLASAAVPDGVICLLSALSFHEVGTQLPSQIWVARRRGTWQPRGEYPPLRIVRFSEQTFTAGIDEHVLEDRVVRIYSIAKTIADCFKFRNKIGFDVALEALTDAWRQRRVRMADLDRYARICRVHNVMRPYLETLVA
jgi:predicted transcriptional regulator of viral defense system